MLRAEGPLLTVDVSTRETTETDIDDKLEAFIGGRGVATKLARQSVYRWKNTYEEEGLAGLDTKEHPNRGRNPKLLEEKLQELEELLLEGAEAHRFEGDLWILSRIVDLIEEEFDVAVSIWSARRYLDKLGWSNQRLQRRALECDAEKIEEWRENWEYREKSRTIRRTYGFGRTLNLVGAPLHSLIDCFSFNVFHQIR